MEAQSPSVAVFEDGASKAVIKVRCIRGSDKISVLMRRNTRELAHSFSLDQGTAMCEGSQKILHQKLDWPNLRLGLLGSRTVRK